jgi:hypothetical protein
VGNDTDISESSPQFERLTPQEELRWAAGRSHRRRFEGMAKLGFSLRGRFPINSIRRGSDRAPADAEIGTLR